MKIGKLAAALAAAACVSFGTAQAQGSSNSLSALTDNIVMKEGFDVPGMVMFAKSIGIPNSRVVQSQNGDIAIFTLPTGAVFVGTTFACNDDGCPGFHFMTFLNANGKDTSRYDFKEFNAPRPHGNAGYIAENDQFVIQRMISSFDGVTRGTLDGEFSIFIGYTSTYVAWLNEQNELIAASATSAGEPVSKIDNQITPESPNAFEANAAEVFQRLKDAGLQDSEIYSNYQPSAFQAN